VWYECEKTKLMCISHKVNNKLKIYVDGQPVEQVSQVKTCTPFSGEKKTTYILYHNLTSHGRMFNEY